DRSIIKTIHDINTKYIKDIRTIILAVVPANVDLNNIYVLGEAERYDPHLERTVPIVTKPDTIEPDLLPSIIEILLNKRKYMKLGYLVMRNSSFKDIDLAWEESKQKEEEFFKSSPLWNKIPEERKGRVNVKTFLGDLLYTHIRKELPHLKRDILDLIDSCEKEIQGMGLPVTSLSSARIRYNDHILKLQYTLTALLSGHYTLEQITNQRLQDLDRKEENGDGNDNSSEAANSPGTTNEPSHYFIRSWLRKLYEKYNKAMYKDQNIITKDKIRELILRYKGNELPGFVSFNTFTQIYSETLIQWEAITREHISDIHGYLHKAICGLITTTMDPLISDLILSEYDQFYKGQVALIDEAIRDVFDDESIPFTLNENYYDTILSRRKQKVEEQIKQLIRAYQDCNAISTGEFARQLTSFANVEKLKDANHNENLAIQDIEEQLLAYCRVARKRIVDIVLLQTIERHMIKRISRFFEKLHSVEDSAISSRLIELPAKKTRRQKLQSKVEVLQKSLSEL
ncbi:hypothetical protein BGW38_004614, partial [Lunasporangiospora selenospora]